MGVFDVIRGRQDSQIVADLEVTEDSHEPKNDLETPPSDSEDRRLSLEAANEKNIEQHPDEITKNAHAGVQKAEAAALVWSKKAVILTYVW